MKLKFEVKKSDLMKVLLLSEMDDESTDKILAKFDELESIDITREDVKEVDDNIPLVMAMLVSIRIAKDLNLK